MIYIATTDNHRRDHLVHILRDAGYEVSTFSRASDCYFAVSACPPRLLIISNELSDTAPLEFLRHLRTDIKTVELPVVMVSTVRSSSECVAALDGGADDYVGGEYDAGELLSRVRLAMRRKSGGGALLYEFEGIALDDERRRVMVDGKPSPLTYTEYEILRLLLRDPGVVLTRSRILERVWGTATVGETRAVDMHIAALRRKLGQRGTLIQTMRGTGYMLARGVS